MAQASKPLAVWSNFLRQKCLWSYVHVVRWAHVNKAQTQIKQRTWKQYFFLLDCAFQVLIGWAGKCLSYGVYKGGGGGSKGNLHQNSQTVTEQGRGPISSPKSLGQFVTVTHALNTNHQGSWLDGQRKLWILFQLCVVQKCLTFYININMVLTGTRRFPLLLAVRKSLSTGTRGLLLD